MANILTDSADHGHDRDARILFADVKKNDLWVFPSGIPHSIPRPRSNGTEIHVGIRRWKFFGVRDSPAERHDWRTCSSKNFGVAEAAWKNLPKQSSFIFQTAVPDHWRRTRKQPQEHLGTRRAISLFARWKCLRPSAQKVERVRMLIEDLQSLNEYCDGNGHSSPGRNAGTALAPNADGMPVLISGKGRMTVMATGNKARTMDFQEGDVGYVEKTLLHYIENTAIDLVFLEMFKSSFYQICRFRSGCPTRHPS